MKEVIKKCEEKMTKTCENLRVSISVQDASNPNSLNRIMAEYCWNSTPAR